MVNDYYTANVNLKNNKCDLFTNILVFSIWFCLSTSNIFFIFTRSSGSQYVIVSILTSSSSIFLCLIFCIWPIYNEQHLLRTKYDRYYIIEENMKYKYIGVILFAWTSIILFDGFSVNNYNNLNIIIASIFPIIAILVGSVIFKNYTRKPRKVALLNNY
jgi:hypothetical protein